MTYQTDNAVLSPMDRDGHKPNELTRRMKARLDHVAELAGVGIATVDRVLNERGNVSPRTAVKVIEAARHLGISRTLPSPYRR